MGKLSLVLLLLALLGPLWKALSGQIDFHADYRTANRNSAHLAPNPEITPEAVIQAYSAYAFNWRGMVAVHTWIAVKPKDADEYTVYQVIGWRAYAGLPVMAIEKDIPDRYWYNQKPDVILDLRGEKAEKLIPKIAEAADKYPYPRHYVAWPGPNSNTYIAFIARQVPELRLALPANALGKDYLSPTHFFAGAPSGTGYQFSLFGVFGITLSMQEGLEINLLGLVYGINPFALSLKLPGFGDLKLAPIEKPKQPRNILP
jgi:hypothetical protein